MCTFKHNNHQIVEVESIYLKSTKNYLLKLKRIDRYEYEHEMGFLQIGSSEWAEIIAMMRKKPYRGVAKKIIDYVDGCIARRMIGISNTT